MSLSNKFLGAIDAVGLKTPFQSDLAWAGPLARL
jgi:hypothetical protein